MSNDVKRSFQPSTLRLLLTFVLFVVAGLATAGFILAEQKLSAYAIEVSHRKVDATGSKQSLQTLQSIKKELAVNQATVQKAKNIKHASDLPQFKAIEDIRNHANANGLSISNVTFAAANAGAAAVTPGGASMAPTAPGAATPLTTTQSNGIDISFTLGGGVINTKDFIQFLYDVEHSTPKLQVQGINAAGGSDASHITIQTMTIKMFTKLPGQS